jgi:SAM-dependent methyltransferase
MADSEHQGGHRHNGHEHAHARGHSHPHAHGVDDEAALATLLDLDAEVFGDYVARVMDWVAGHADGLASSRILDLGCGTGVGTFALLRRAEDAEVIAVDGSDYMLERVRGKARGLGVDERVHAVKADLDQPWPDFGTVDVVWTAAFMHHLADPHAALRALFDTLRPGGLLAVIEMDGFPRFLPDSVGAGLEERCHAAVAELSARQLPHRGDDWGVHLADAGFTIEEARTFDIHLDPPLPDSAGRYALASLGRLRPRLEGVLSGEDLAALDALLDPARPESLLRREDLHVRTRRLGWAARRP